MRGGGGGWGWGHCDWGGWGRGWVWLGVVTDGHGQRCMTLVLHSHGNTRVIVYHTNGTLRSQ